MKFEEFLEWRLLKFLKDRCLPEYDMSFYFSKIRENEKNLLRKCEKILIDYPNHFVKNLEIRQEKELVDWMLRKYEIDNSELSKNELKFENLMQNVKLLWKKVMPQK